MGDSAEIFLSYAREDQATARRFAEALQQAGFSVWWDQSLTAGEAFDEVTERALTDARAVVVLWSPHSAVSRWVRAEAAQADENGTLVPALIEPCNVPIKFKLTQTADLSDWEGDPAESRWQEFVAGLRRFTGRTLAQAAPAAATIAAAPLRKPASGWIVAGLVVLGLIGGGIWLVEGRNGTDVDTGPARQGSAPRAVPAVPSVAVLPFADLSPGGDQGSFADGMTEEILGTLARISGLQVTGRTSSFYFKGRNESLQSIGQQLGVNYLLEGSVRKQGEAIRVSAQLVSAADGFNLWSRTYDPGAQDLFDIQQDIAQSVAEALQVALGVGELGRQSGMTRDVQAYEEYVEGLGEARKFTLDGYQQAAAKFEAAIRRDETFFRAWRASHDAYLDAALNAARDVPHRNSLRSKAEFVRQEIGRRFPDDREAQSFLEFTSELERGDWIRIAQRDIGVATRPDLSQAPGADPAGNLLRAGVARLRLDKSREAIIDLEQARKRDPLNPAVLLALPEAYANAGRFDEALAENDHAWSLAPSEPIAVNGLVIASSAGNSAKIGERWQRVLSLQAPDSPLRDLHALQGRPDAQREVVQRLARQQPRAPTSHLALLAALVGDADLALQVLREDQDLLRRQITVIALWRPIMRDVRRLPGFKALVTDWGFVDYWREFGWGEHCRPVGADDFECQ
jgi:TolB-like protein